MKVIDLMSGLRSHRYIIAPAPPQLRVYRARVQRDATVKVNCSMSSIPDKASYSINMSPPVGNMEHEHTTEDFYFGATGLGLGKNYMFGIFATMQDGKRTDVRSMTYKTRKYFNSPVSRCEL